MRYKILPNTDLSISVISLGTWVFSGDVWGDAPEKDCIEVVHTAIECGINLIDTAPIYGYGRSEEIVGRAIRGRRSKVLIATKCGLKGRDSNITVDQTPDFIRKDIEGSLKRLGIDCIDIYQCHWPDQATPIEETMEAMLSLQKEGKIHYIGLSNYPLSELKEALKYAKIATIQEHYSLLERSLEKELLPFCQKNGIGILTYGSLGGGILTGKYKEPTKFSPSDARSFFYRFYNGEDYKKSEKIIAVMKEISERIKKPLNQIAINWIWQKEGITSAIAGSRNSRQIKDNALAAEWQLSEEDLKRLDNLIDPT